MRGRGPHPLSAAKQMLMHGFEGRLVTIESSLYMHGVVRQTDKTLTHDGVTTNSSRELLQQIVAMREGERFLHPVIATFLNWFTSCTWWTNLPTSLSIPSAGEGDKWPQRETQDAKLKETEATDVGMYTT